MTYIVVDLDSTLADNSHREHFIAEGREDGKDWESFHNAMEDDAVFSDVDGLLDSLIATDIIFLTARDEKYRRKTVNWLKDKQIKFQGYLIMRDRPHSEETAADFKLRQLRILEEEYGHKPLFCLEDQMNITLKLREAGFIVWNVRNGHA